jgi:transposase
MTCVTCARHAPAARTARVSAASQTRLIPSGSRVRRSRTPLLPRAFKRSGDSDTGPDEQHELLAVWWTARCSLRKRRQHLLSQAEALFGDLPLALIERLPASTAVRPRLAALAGATRRRRLDAPTTLRVRLLNQYHGEIAELDAQEKQITRELRALVQASGSTLGELCGLSTVSVAELLVEVGDPRRFTEGGFARFNATAPLAASTGEGPGEPIRHRHNPGGNRRVNAILHRMAVTQLRCEPRAQAIYANARARGHHTKKEARRILKRHLSDLVHRRMIRDLASHPRPAPPRCQTPRGRRAVKGGPTGPSQASRVAAALDGDRRPRATISQGGA